MGRGRSAPYNPMAAVTAQIKPAEIDCPIEIGAKVVALRNFKGDPLSWLWSHGQISQHQHEAGMSYQADAETLAGDLRAMDPGREYVDGRRPPQPATDRQRRSRNRINHAHAVMGGETGALVHDVLIDGCSMNEVARKRGLVGRKWTDHFGKRFREALDQLAVAYGFATATRH